MLFVFHQISIIEKLSDSKFQYSSNYNFENYILGSTNPKLQKHLSSNINKESIEINKPENKKSKTEFIDEKGENKNKKIIEELSDSKLKLSGNPKFEKHILGSTNPKLEKHILGPLFSQYITSRKDTLLEIKDSNINKESIENI